MDTIIDRRTYYIYKCVLKSIDMSIFTLLSLVNYLFIHKRGNYLSEVLKGLRPGTGVGKIADYEMDILACRA